MIASKTFLAAGVVLLSVSLTATAAPPATQPASTQPATTQPYQDIRPTDPNVHYWSTPWPFEPEQGGAQHKTFRSALVNQDIGYTIWLPPEYQQRADARFPVIYWLHGTGGDEVMGSRRISADLGKAIEAGKCPPAIIVFINGYRDSFYVDSVDKKVPMESIIIKELIPHIDANYRTVADRTGRGIEGFSMGGYGAMRLGMKYHEMFSSIVVLSGAFINEDIARSRRQAAFAGDMDYFRACHPNTIVRANADAVRGRTKVFMACGDKDGGLERNKQFNEMLGELKIESSFYPVAGVAHETLPMYAGLGARTWESHAKAWQAAQAAQTATAPTATRPARPQAEGRPRLWSHTPNWPNEPGSPLHPTFHSELVNEDVAYTICLPKEYESRPQARFPVVYSLHGIDGNEVDGARRFARFVNAAVDASKCPPTIFVMVNGYGPSFYVDSFDKTVPMESIIIKELIPHIDKTYRTVAGREGRGIVGFSMGGYGAMRLGLKYPEMFSSIVSLGGAYIGQDTGRSRGGAAFGGNMEYFQQCDPTTIARANAEKVRAGKMQILIACGDQDGLIGRNRQFDALLTELNVEHAFQVVPGVGHDQMNMYEGLGTTPWEIHAKGFGLAPAASLPATAPAK